MPSRNSWGMMHACTSTLGQTWAGSDEIRACLIFMHRWLAARHPITTPSRDLCAACNPPHTCLLRFPAPLITGPEKFLLPAEGCILLLIYAVIKLNNEVGKHPRCLDGLVVFFNCSRNHYQHPSPHSTQIRNIRPNLNQYHAVSNIFAILGVSQSNKVIEKPLSSSVIFWWWMYTSSVAQLNCLVCWHRYMDFY